MGREGGVVRGGRVCCGDSASGRLGFSPIIVREGWESEWSALSFLS